MIGERSKQVCRRHWRRLLVAHVVVCSSVLGIGASEANAGGRIIYVRSDAPESGDGSSWENAFRYLQDALASALSGDQIWVAAGVYHPDERLDPEDGIGLDPNWIGNRTATFNLVNGVGLFGGFSGSETALDERDSAANVTMLSGDLVDDDDPSPSSNCCSPHGSPYCDDTSCALAVCERNPRCCDTEWTMQCALLASTHPACCQVCGNVCDNSFHVVTGIEVLAAELDGFTVTGGAADGICCPVGGGGAGAGISLYDSDATIRNCTVARNRATGGGAGIVVSLPGQILIDNTSVLDNHTPDLGGGMRSNGDGVRVLNSTFANNRARLGGGIYNDGRTPIINTECYGNHAFDNGGGIYHSSNGTMDIINSTVVANTAAAVGGGVVLSTAGIAQLNVYNSIVWGNTSITGAGDVARNQLSTTFGGEPAVRYSCVEDGNPKDNSIFPGLGNIDDDPLFVLPCHAELASCAGEPDLRLLNGSPCIDSADNTQVPDGIVYDRLGLPRFVDDPETPDTGFCLNCEVPIADMGAHEYVPNTADCNANGTPDWQDIDNGTSSDCNRNGVPDECDISPGPSGEPPFSDDCNANGQPDECDVVQGGSSPDCNGNGVPDECDVAGGASKDCIGADGSTPVGNGIPDECESVALGKVTSTWTHAGRGRWSDPTNWCPEIVPDNDAQHTFNVAVPIANAEVILDISPTVTSVALGTGATVVVDTESGAHFRVLAAEISMENSGAFAAQDERRLLLDAPRIDQLGDCSTGGQLLAANGGILQVSGAEVNGGVLTIETNGQVQLIANAEIVGTCVDGVVVPDGQRGGFRGDILNDAIATVAGRTLTTTLASTVGDPNNARFIGTGSIRLLHQSYSVLGDANGAFTNGSGHAIEGAGIVKGVLVNNGVISANADRVNHSLPGATSGGTLWIAGNVGGSGELTAAGGTLRVAPTGIAMTVSTGSVQISDTSALAPGEQSLKSSLQMGAGVTMMAAAPMDIGPNGSFIADRKGSGQVQDGGSLNAPSAQVHGSQLYGAPGGMSLTSAMSFSVNAGLEVGDDKGGGKPPPICRVYDSARIEVAGDLVLSNRTETSNSVDITYRSSALLALGGDFVNHSEEPELFDWTRSGIALGALGETTHQYFEVAGLDVGASLDGFKMGARDGCSGEHSNFSLGRLELKAGSITEFRNTIDNTHDTQTTTEALYVGTLVIEPGSGVSVAEGARIYYIALDGSPVGACTSGCSYLQPIPCTGGVEACLPLIEDCSLQACLIGPGESVPSACRVYDRDADGDVDLLDVGNAP